jgi:hypothetical protein
MKKIKVNMDNVLSIQYEYGTSKPVEVANEGDSRRKENDGGDEPIRGIIHVYMVLSQQNPLYNCHK